MTRWWDHKQQVDRSLEIQLFLWVYCSPMHTSSALQTCEHLNITLCIRCLWAPLYFFVHLVLQYKWNQPSSNNSRHVYIRGCMRGSDLTWWPPNQTLSVHWNATGQTALEPHWLMLYRPVAFQWQPGVNLHNGNTLEDHWSHKYTGMPLEPQWLMIAPSGIPVAIQC